MTPALSRTPVVLKLEICNCSSMHTASIGGEAAARLETAKKSNSFCASPTGWQGRAPKPISRHLLSDVFVFGSDEGGCTHRQVLASGFLDTDCALACN